MARLNDSTKSDMKWHKIEWSSAAKKVVQSFRSKLKATRNPRTNPKNHPYRTSTSTSMWMLTEGTDK